MLLRQAVVLAAFLVVAVVVISILPEVAVQALPVPLVLAGLLARAESLFAVAAAPLILPLSVFVIPAALVAETVPLLELQPAAAVPAAPLVVAALALQVAPVVEAVLVVELEPVAVVVLLVLAARVAVALAVAPVLVLVVDWRSELPSVVAGCQVAHQ